MSKFKVGDRVAVYSYLGRSVGTLSADLEEGCWNVHYGFNGQLAHEKQLRRLKPKAKKETRTVWINEYPYGEMYAYNHRMEADVVRQPSRAVALLECVVVKRHKVNGDK